MSSKSKTPKSPQTREPSKSEQLQNLYNEFVVSVDLDEEFEIRFGTKGVKHTTKIDFDNVIAYLKGKGFQLHKKEYSLKMQVEYTNPRTGRTEFSPIRIEVEGLQNISEYCKTNSLKKTDGGNAGNVGNGQQQDSFLNGVIFRQKMRKRRADGTFIRYVENNDYNFRASYQSEKVLKKTSSIAQTIVDKWSDRKKLFRYIERYSFVHPSFPQIQVDMSVVKASKKNERGNMIPTFTVSESDVFDSPLSYEIEAELLKSGLYAFMHDSYFSHLKNTIKYILCGYQQTNYPVSYSTIRNVLQEYMTLIHGKPEDGAGADYHKIRPRNFIGPSSITLEMKNIQVYDTETKTPNIRTPYSVTDKADGYRKLLFVDTKGDIYMIDTNMNVQYTGYKTTSKEHTRSILDGEHILHNKQGVFINLFACFDVYYIHGKDRRDLEFIQIGTDDEASKYRINLLNSYIHTLNPTPIAGGGTPLRVEMKSFYASTGEVGKHTIFDSCRKVIEKIDAGFMEYETDGLIFTPIRLGVGQDTRGEPITNYKKTWMHSFKWKPVEQNTVDFLVTTKKDERGKDMVQTIYQDGVNGISGSNISQYKTLILRVGFDENIHGYINPCKDVIENKLPKLKGLDNEETYKPVPFYPYNPSDPKASICNVMLKTIMDTNYLTTETKDIHDKSEIFEDNMIVEFRYDMGEKEGWKWKPIKVRYDKTAEYRSGIRNYGNAFHVAQSVWSSIHNPITKEMIVTGANIPSYEEDDDVYYNRTGKTYTKELRDFHNLYVKNRLIRAVSKRGNTLYDLAVGKAGDFTKWISANLRFVFGVDISKDNIENRKDGACARYLNYRKQYKSMPNALFVNANSSLNIKNGDGVFSDKGKEIVRAIFGEGPRDKSVLGEGVYNQYGIGEGGFNVVSVQFALHYFFQNQETLHNFVRNVSEGCAMGGYFIGTSYDGKRVFQALRAKKVGESVVAKEEDYKIWEITKMYDAEEFNDDETSLGYRVDVYQESINKTFTEYLVNYDFFNRVMMNYGFDLITRDEARRIGLPNGSGLFDELFTQMREEIRKERRGKEKGSLELEVGKAIELHKYEKQKMISFLNRYFVYKKVRDVDASKVYGIMGGDATLPQEAELERLMTTTMKKVAREVSKPKDGVTGDEAVKEQGQGVEKKKTEKKVKKRGTMKLKIAE